MSNKKLKVSSMFNQIKFKVWERSSTHSLLQPRLSKATWRRRCPGVNHQKQKFRSSQFLNFKHGLINVCARFLPSCVLCKSGCLLVNTSGNSKEFFSLTCTTFYTTLPLPEGIQFERPSHIFLRLSSMHRAYLLVKDFISLIATFLIFNLNDHNHQNIYNLYQQAECPTEWL